MLYDFRIQMMRLFTLYAHILCTTILFWTKVDCIRVNLNPFVNNDNDYRKADISYTGLIATAVIMLLIEVFYAATEVHITWATMVHLFLDVIAILFTTFVFLDGLPWQNYIPVWVFCVMIPCLYDIGHSFLILAKELRVRVRGPSEITSCWPFNRT